MIVMLLPVFPVYGSGKSHCAVDKRVNEIVKMKDKKLFISRGFLVVLKQ